MNATIDVTNVTLQTDRLLLRPFKETDLDDFFEYASVDGVGQMAGWLPHKSKDVTKWILKSFIESKKTFAIVEKETNKVIGSLGLELCDAALEEEFHSLKGREIGYVLSKDYWGRGLMPEAVEAVIRYCLNDLQYDFLSCVHYIENKQSKRVIEKAGFTYYKNIMRQTSFGERHLSMIYVIKKCKLKYK